CSHDLPGTLQAIVEKVHNNFETESTALLLLNDTSRELHCETALGSGAGALKATRMIRAGNTGPWVLQAGDPLLLEELNRDDALAGTNYVPRGDLHSVLYIPVRSSENVFGAFRLANCMGGGTVHEEDLSVLYVLAVYAAVALEKHRYFE